MTGFDDEDFPSKSRTTNFGGRTINTGASNENSEIQKVKKKVFLYIQRTNSRILVFVVPMEFVAVQPIE
jgi:hypothetical protein